MKIKEITGEHILFDNGSKITYHHTPDCCECNYADFEQVDDLAKNIDFLGTMQFEKVDDKGFRFGTTPENMTFVPCYSLQNGYYSSSVDIWYNGENALYVECEWIEY